MRTRLPLMLAVGLGLAFAAGTSPGAERRENRMVRSRIVGALSLVVAVSLAALPAQAEAPSPRSTALTPVDASWLPDYPRTDRDMTRYVINDASLYTSIIPGGSVAVAQKRKPLPTNPHHLADYYCSGYDHPNCQASDIHFTNQLPRCFEGVTWNCIASLEVTRDGTRMQSRHVRDLDLTGPLNTSVLGKALGGLPLITSVDPVTDFAGDPARDLPPGGAVSLWTVPGLDLPEDSLFAVSIVMEGRALTGAKASLESFWATVIPVIARPAPSPFAPAIVSWRDQDGHVGLGGMGGGGPADAAGSDCIYSDVSHCYVRAQYPDGLTLTLTANLSSSLSGWLHGRLSEPNISIEQLDDRTNSVKISGAPVDLPVTYKDFVNEDLQEDLRFNPPVWWPSGEPWQGQFNLYADGEWRFQWFERVMPLLDDRATAIVTTWAVRAVVGWELPPCLRSTSQLLGLVTTNAMMYNGGPPRFIDGRLNYRVAGLHYEPDGSVKRGDYSLIMRSSVARCLYGFADAPVSAEISVVSDDGVEQVATTAVAESEGWLRLTAQNFTFSSPTIQVKLSQKGSEAVRLVCRKTNPKVKGPKRVVVTGTVAAPPTCPKGYRRG